jgi:hypothetical protein
MPHLPSLSGTEVVCYSPDGRLCAYVGARFFLSSACPKFTALQQVCIGRDCMSFTLNRNKSCVGEYECVLFAEYAAKPS